MHDEMHVKVSIYDHNRSKMYDYKKMLGNINAKLNFEYAVFC